MNKRIKAGRECKSPHSLPLFAHFCIKSATTALKALLLRLFILPTHAIWSVAFRCSLMPSVSDICFTSISNFSSVCRSTSAQWLFNLLLVNKLIYGVVRKNFDAAARTCVWNTGQSPFESLHCTCFMLIEALPRPVQNAELVRWADGQIHWPRAVPVLLLTSAVSCAKVQKVRKVILFRPKGAIT